MPQLKLPKLSPPLPRTYWVQDETFLAGAYAGQPTAEAHRERLDGLLTAGARTFVNLMEEHETNNEGKPFVPYQDLLQQLASGRNTQVDCVRFPIVDRSVTTQTQMGEILNAIDESLALQRPVYVHCFGGIGRTGTVVSCWLLRHDLARKDNVFEVLRGLRKVDVRRASRPAPENEAQRQFVLDWPEGS